MIGGLEEGLKLNFNKTGTLLTFLIADAPCHGKQYHDLPKFFDHYHDKIADNTIENLMIKYKKVNTASYFCAFKLTSKTDKVFNIMKQTFGGEGFVITPKTEDESDFMDMFLEQTTTFLNQHL